MKKLLALTIFCSVLVATSKAQEADSVLNDLLFDEDILLSMLEQSTTYQFLYTSMEYRNQTYFAGRDIGINQFTLTNQVSYIHSNGISAGLTTVYYSEFEPKLNTTILSAGYGKTLGNFRLRANFDKYFFADVDSLVDSSFHSALTFGASYRLKYMRTSFNWSFLLGSEPSSQASWDLKGYVDLWKKDYKRKLRLEPAISLLFGGEYFWTTTSTPIGRGIFERLVETETLEQRWGLLNTQLRIPLVLTYNNFDIGVGYNYNLPHALDGQDLGNTSYFNISLGYLFDLKKK